MEGVGFGLAILSEFRANTTSLKQPYDCYKQCPKLFEKVETTSASKENDTAKLVSLPVFIFNPIFFPVPILCWICAYGDVRGEMM